MLDSEELKTVRKTRKHRKGVMGPRPADTNILIRRFAKAQGVKVVDAKVAIQNLSSVIRLMLLEGFDVRLRTVGIFLQKFDANGTLPLVRFKYSKRLLKELRNDRPMNDMENLNIPTELDVDPWNRY